MGSSSPPPEYTGLDKYPGWIATVVTLALTGMFLGALYVGANSHHGEHAADHGEGNGEESHGEDAH